MTDQRLAGRVALVTGASSGLGRAIALRYAREGASVVCCDLQPAMSADGYDAGRGTHEEIAVAGGRAEFVRCDVTDPAALHEAVAAAVATFGRLDIGVANAGISERTHALVDEPWDDYRRTVAINQDGVWHTCRAVARHLVGQGDGGRIIAVASIAGLVGIPVGAHYVMTKHAVVGLVRVLAGQLATAGITVNAICPGYARTGMNRVIVEDDARRSAVEGATPIGRLAEPDDIAGAAFFLASDDAAYVTGIALPVDGGYTAI